jgi:hypothetical protein
LFIASILNLTKSLTSLFATKIELYKGLAVILSNAPAYPIPGIDLPFV